MSPPEKTANTFGRHGEGARDSNGADRCSLLRYGASLAAIVLLLSGGIYLFVGQDDQPPRQVRELTRSAKASVPGLMRSGVLKRTKPRAFRDASPISGAEGPAIDNAPQLSPIWSARVPGACPSNPEGNPGRRFPMGRIRQPADLRWTPALPIVGSETDWRYRLSQRSEPGAAHPERGPAASARPGAGW